MDEYDTTSASCKQPNYLFSFLSSPSHPRISLRWRRWWCCLSDVVTTGTRQTIVRLICSSLSIDADHIRATALALVHRPFVPVLCVATRTCVCVCVPQRSANIADGDSVASLACMQINVMPIQILCTISICCRTKYRHTLDQRSASLQNTEQTIHTTNSYTIKQIAQWSVAHSPQHKYT